MTKNCTSLLGGNDDSLENVDDTARLFIVLGVFSTIIGSSFNTSGVIIMKIEQDKNSARYVFYSLFKDEQQLINC